VGARPGARAARRKQQARQPHQRRRRRSRRRQRCSWKARCHHHPPLGPLLAARPLQQPDTPNGHSPSRRRLTPVGLVGQNVKQPAFLRVPRQHRRRAVAAAARAAVAALAAEHARYRRGAVVAGAWAGAVGGGGGDGAGEYSDVWPARGRRLRAAPPAPRLRRPQRQPPCLRHAAPRAHPTRPPAPPRVAWAATPCHCAPAPWNVQAPPPPAAPRAHPLRCPPPCCRALGL
jgi:hypothetical protein